MRVIVPPVVVGDRICRIVSAVESLLEVEEWAGQWWAPSTVTLSAASHAPAADASALLSRGVPPEDCVVTTPRPGISEIQALLQARDPARAQDMLLNEQVMRSNPPRRRSYPGNARFSSRTIAAVERMRQHPALQPPAEDARTESVQGATDGPAEASGAG